MRAFRIMYLALCALLVTACAKEHRIVLTLPDAATCAALCVERLQVAITVDGSPVTEESYACNDTLAFDAPAEGSTVTIEVTGVDATGAAVASARSSGRFGNVQRPRLQALTAGACGTPVDAQVDLGVEDRGVGDLGAEDLGVPDQGDQDAADQSPPDQSPDHALPDLDVDQSAMDAAVDGMPDAAPAPQLTRIDPAPLDNAQAIFAAEQGNDANPGSMQRPVRTFARAHQLAVEQGKVIVLATGEFRANAPLQVSVYGNFDTAQGVWQQRPYDLLHLDTELESAVGRTLRVAADLTLMGVTFMGKADHCALELTDNHRVEMSWVLFLSRARQLLPGDLPSCALRQTAGQIYAESIGVSDGVGLQTIVAPEPARAALRVEGGRFEAINAVLNTRFDWAPGIEVFGDATVSLHSVLMVGGYGIAAHGGQIEVAQASFDVIHAAVVLPEDSVDGQLSLVNALVKTRSPGSGVVGYHALDQIRTRLTLQGVLKAAQSAQCWLRRRDGVCHYRLREFEECAEAFCVNVADLRVGEFSYEGGWRQSIGSPGIGTGIDIAPWFDGPTLPNDLYNTPWPAMNPDLGWLQRP